MDKKIWIALAVLVVLAVGAWAVIASSNKSDTSDNASTSQTTSNNSGQTSTSSNSSQSSQSTATNAVTIESFAFTPANITVKVGDTVTWTNNDSTAHTVTGANSGGPNSGTLQKGQSYSFKFTTAGSYKYACKFHPSMTGTVTVQ